MHIVGTRVVDPAADDPDSTGKKPRFRIRPYNTKKLYPEPTLKNRTRSENIYLSYQKWIVNKERKVQFRGILDQGGQTNRIRIQIDCIFGSTSELSQEKTRVRIRFQY